MVMASPSWEVPTPEGTQVWYSPGALSYASAMTIPAGVAPISVATMAPHMVANGSTSWNHMPSVVWCGVLWCGVIWCGVVCRGKGRDV